MSNSTQAIERRGFGVTLRRDAWWLEPAMVAVGLGLFGVYSTWAAWQGNNYEWGPYLSPFYSPLILVDWWKFSPSFLILWMPLGFRATCYYYRKAYYRAYFLDPPACAVGEPSEHRYCGENKFPFILQNLHRYFFYLATLVLAFLWYDAYKGFFFNGQFGVGVGTLVLLVNCVLLSCYTFGCHSLRHLVGGRKDEISKSPVSQACYNCSSALNGRHMLFAWLSLFSVGLTDVYIRLCSMGAITDLRIL